MTDKCWRDMTEAERETELEEMELENVEVRKEMAEEERRYKLKSGFVQNSGTKSPWVNEKQKRASPIRVSSGNPGFPSRRTTTSVDPLYLLRHQQNVDEWEKEHPVIRSYKKEDVRFNERQLKNGDSIVVYHYIKPHLLKYIKHRSSHNPTIKEVEKFMRTSPVVNISKQPFNRGEYMCMDYAMQLHNLAEDFGIKCGIASLRYSVKGSVGHSINVFNVIGEHCMFYFTQTGELVDIDDLLENNTSVPGKGKIVEINIYW